MKNKIQALSVRQPWAELILAGRKTIEIRSWHTDYRGKLWLHSGARGDESLEQEFGFPKLFHGGYVGLVTLDIVIPMNPERWDLWREEHLVRGHYQARTYAWILSSPRRFKEPIPAPGRLGLFLPSPAIEDKLRRATLG
jgi:hypothetical protein